MSYIGKIVNLVLTTTPFDPKSIFEQQKTLVIKSTMVEPTLNIGSVDWSYLLVMVPILPCILVQTMGVTIERHILKRKKRSGIAKDGLGTSK